MATPIDPTQLIPVPVPVTDELAGVPLDAFAPPVPPGQAPPDEAAGLPPLPLPPPLPPVPFADELAGPPVPMGAGEISRLPLPPPFDDEPQLTTLAAPTQPSLEQPDIDALTGGSLAGQFATPQLPPEYAAPTFEPGQRDPFAGFTDQEAFSIVESMDPVQLARTEALQNQIRDTEILRKKLEADQENLRQIRNNAEIQRQANEHTMAKEAQIEADAAELSRRGIDRTRWFREASTVQKVAAIIGTLVGGAMSKPGQPNQGVLFAADIIDKDVEDQKYEIENARADIQRRTGAVAREYQRTGDLHRATEAVRLASYQAVLAELQTQQQNFDIRGTSFLEYGKGIQAMQGRMAQAAEESRRRSLDEGIKIGEFKLKLLERQDKLAKAGAAAGAARADKIVYEPRALAAMNPGLPVPPVGMTLKGYDDWLRTQKVGEEYKTARRQNDPAERARELGVSDMFDQSGEPAHFRSIEIAGKLAETKGKVAGSAALIDQIVSARNNYGWSSNLLKSPEWRQIKADYIALQLTQKDVFGLGVIQGEDLQLLEGALGTKDPTEMRDPIPGLLASRANMVNMFNQAAQAQAAPGVKLSRWEPPSLILPEAGETPEQARRQLLQEDAGEDFRGAAKHEIDKRTLGLSPDQLRDYDVMRAIRGEALDAAEAKFTPGVSIKQQDAIAELELAARGPVGDPAADSARQDLQTIADNGKTAALQAAARRALQAAATPPGEEPPVRQPIREVQRETVPPPRPRGSR